MPKFNYFIHKTQQMMKFILQIYCINYLSTSVGFWYVQ